MIYPLQLMNYFSIGERGWGVLPSCLPIKSTTQYLASGCHYIRMNVCTGSSKCVRCGLRWCCEAFCVQGNRILLQHSRSDEIHLIRVEIESTRQPQGTPSCCTFPRTLSSPAFDSLGFFPAVCLPRIGFLPFSISLFAK